MTMKDEELYEGFTKEQIEHYRREARRLFDPAVVEKSEQRVRKMSKEQWKSVKKEGEEITQRLAGLMHRKPGDPEVQKWIGQHHAHIERFYQAPAAVYRGLGGLYVEHPEFKAHYEKYRPGLAEFMKAAMEYYCVHTLKG